MESKKDKQTQRRRKHYRKQRAKYMGSPSASFCSSCYVSL